MNKMNIPYTKHEITPEDIQSVTAVLESGVLTNGTALVNFEEAFAHHVDSPQAVGVSSGTAGLHLAVKALGVKPGQTVIVPSLTFAATANAALYEGAKVEFVDIDPKTLLLDDDEVEERLANSPEKYAGVIAVDFAGYPVDTQRLSEVCGEYGAWLVEDAAHALGAVSIRDGTEVKVGEGQFADATVFSFHPAKHITTGEGGMVTTRDEELYERLKLLRSHAMDKGSDQSAQGGWYYRIDELGYNYRMSELNAALGLSQLQRADDNLAARQAIAKAYRAAFEGSAISLPDYDSDQTNAYHLFVARVDGRKRVYDALRDKGVFAQVHYVPLHLQPLYQGANGQVSLPNTERYYREGLSIPMYPTLGGDEQAYVIEALKEAAG